MPEASDTDAAQGAEAEVSTEQTVDELLAEFEQESQPSQSPQPAETAQSNDRIDKVVQYVEQDQQAKARQQTEDSLNAAAKLMAESVEGVDESVLRALVVAGVVEDNRAQNLWNQRHNNPKAWESYVTGLAKEKFSGTKGEPEDISQSRAAARAAVRANSGSTQPDSDIPDFRNRS